MNEDFKELKRLCILGNKSACNQLITIFFDQYSQPLIVYVKGLVSSQLDMQVVEDIVTDSLIDFLTHELIKDKLYELENNKGLLYRITWCNTQDKLRALKRTVSIEVAGDQMEEEEDSEIDYFLLKKIELIRNQLSEFEDFILDILIEYPQKAPNGLAYANIMIRNLTFYPMWETHEIVIVDEMNNNEIFLDKNLEWKMVSLAKEQDLIDEIVKSLSSTDKSWKRWNRIKENLKKKIRRIIDDLM